jgi:hypothetical protein
MLRPLHTWQLTPTSTPSALWYLSTARTAVCVRAAGPLEARELAAVRFGQGMRAPGTSWASPWLDPDLVHCAKADDQEPTLVDEPCIVATEEPLLVIATLGTR